MEITSDVIIGGGLTLSGLLSGLAKLLYSNGYFLKYKKYTGIGLIVLGIAISTGVSYFSGANNATSLFVAALTGLMAGLGAVGMQSTLKNAIEGMNKPS